MAVIGNEIWNSATDNRDKAVISMSADDFRAIYQKLEDSGLNYRAYRVASGFKMAVNAVDVGTVRDLAGKNLETSRSNVPFSPPEKNIIGNTEYRYISQKEYLSADRDLILKMADEMEKQGIKYSGRIYPTGKGTLTVSRTDLARVRAVRDDIITRRSQVGIGEKGQVIGNRSVSSQNRHLYMSTLTPKQYEEVKPFIETNARYSGVIRDGKVMFSVDRVEAQAFHRAFDTAKREVGLIHTMQSLGLPMEQMVALSPVMHRLAAEDAQLQLADFFDKRYDEAQFGEMLSLVNAYIDQAPAERYGERSKLNDMLEAKSSFDRSIELSDFFSQHDFSYEQKSAIANMFVGEVTRGQVDSIDETFTAEDIRAYDEILHNALHESDVADFLTAHKQAVIDRENANRVPTEEEVLFPQADLAKFIAERTLSSDEWEDMAYPLFENGYLDKHKPSDKASFGYHLPEAELFSLAQRYRDGEDIRRELALGLLEHSNTEDIEFVFEDGKISDRTYYYAENLRHSLHTERTEDGYNCSFSGMERFVSLEEIGQAFLDRTHEEFEDLAYWAVLDFIKDDIPDISDDTVRELISAFDGAALHGWENGDNQPKLNRIKKALFDVLGNEEQTEKAFACIAKHKYNVTFEAETPEKQTDSLTFHFGKDKSDEWVSESDIVHDFALAHPDCSFALGNAVLEYLDEKQHSERNIPELKAGWYKKTDFSITAIISGEEFNYDGRFDIGDGKGTGGGSLIDHIRTYNEGMLGYTQHPFNQPEYKERVQRMLDIFVPFLEAHSELTAEEQKILEDFKEQYPIRTLDDVEKAQEKSAPSVTDLAVGDIIMYDGARREIEEISSDRIKMKDLDAPDYGGILLGTSDVLAYDGWQQDMENKGFEILTKAEKLQTLQQVVDKFFGTDCESAETEHGTWKLAIADGEKVGELFHNGEAVCGIYNRVDKMEIEPYLELSSFPKMLADAMITHNPDKPVEIMDFALTFKDPLDRAKYYIDSFCEAEYRDGGDFTDLHSVPLAYTTLTDDELPINVKADLINYTITYEFDGEEYSVEQYNNIEEMNENALSCLDFSDLVSVPDEVIERHTTKDEQTVELMSDASEIKDISSQADEPKPITMEFKGDSESLDEISNYALSIGAVIIKDNASGTLSVDTYDNHREELQNLAYMNGISCEIKGETVPEQTAETIEKVSEPDMDDDAPLFADADVIDQIQADEKADVPFWQMPDVQGEQLSLFGDSEPLTATKPTKDKQKSEFAKGPVVDGVQVYEALAAEIDRGTGFVHGKLRVQDFYEEKHPTIQQLADFLKKEYGIGGHSGEGNISLVDYDSKGLTFSFENGEKYRHSWYNVATMTEARLRNDTYLSAEQKEERAALKAEKAEEYTAPDTVEVGDRFRHKITGEVSEVISLTGALPFYTDDCTVRRESDGFSITGNISYDKLLNSGMYEYIGRAEPEKEQSAPVKPEPSVASETEKTEIPTVEATEQEVTTPDKGENFTITNANLGDGGAKTKFRANVEAIKTLKALEREKRPATPEEKEKLSRYVGWGAISQAFDGSNDKWSAEYAELKNLLTPQEYVQARSTVNDAFYTSPTVIDRLNG